MKALITGASSGIGREMCIYLSTLGYDIIAVARNKDNLETLKEVINTKLTTIATDLSIKENCFKLFDEIKDEHVDVFINNAGFGVFGEFNDTSLDKEIDMINTNITSVHILSKLILQDMVIRHYGYILNVASLAAFVPGPLMSSYYASKAYVLRLTQGIYKELKKENSNVSISALCPGPVDTNFSNIAGVEFAVKPLDSKYVAKYAIDKMFKHKLVIVPGVLGKITKFFSKTSPDKLTSSVSYRIQCKKLNKKSVLPS